LEEINPTESLKRNARFFQNDTFDAAFTSVGNASTLGVIRTEEMEIRCFGPQGLPLNKANQFGIVGEGLNGFYCVFSQMETWVQFEPEIKEDLCKLKFNFVGVRPESPLAL